MTFEEKMRLVLKLAEEGMLYGELPIAAIIFHDDEIVSKAYTTEKQDERYLIHAELKALLAMDEQKYPISARRKMQLFTNLEPCMMCLGAAIHSFVGEIYYSIESPTDGGVVWMEKTWDGNHAVSSFKPPKVFSGILEKESRELFEEYLKICPNGSMHNWVKTLI
ncbi:tRNA-specific adenosine deaminase [Oxobacter pfennigii]|uniref:tRNA-specific adenosine deaminase n=1 Tax=Oxobacter pfennigii TaxID=36849 RepID=A0A0P8WDQ1_9CLOT|nr:deaminase [Oxobacter pfennigii]KPU45878.1 tRNA-specific adenosine deaminase [Oxobacter pfennigii]